MIVYGLSTCDTCRKVRRARPHAAFADVRADGVPEATLIAALDKFDAALVNTRSTTWRNLDAVERSIDSLKLLQKYPTLMKRPLIDVNGILYLGWGPEAQAATIE